MRDPQVNPGDISKNFNLFAYLIRVLLSHHGLCNELNLDFCENQEIGFQDWKQFVDAISSTQPNTLTHLGIDLSGCEMASDDFILSLTSRVKFSNLTSLTLNLGKDLLK